MSKKKKYNIILCCIIFGSVLLGLVLWAFLPSTIEMHFVFTEATDGFKNRLLPLFLLPFFAFIPEKTPEIHYEDPDAMEKYEAERALNKLKQIRIASVLCGILWVFLLGTAYYAFFVHY